jgi:branched-chain amino acid transport system permease protein
MRDRYVFAIIAALVIAAPFVLRPVIAAEILIFAIAAVANNIMLGYTGLLSFGQAIFFGIGAYTTGLMIIHWHAPLWLVLPAAVIANAVLAVVVGYFCVQRIGLYFIMLTFAFNQMFYFIAYSWTTLTGGEDGLPGVTRPSYIRGDVSFYVFVAVLFVACLLLMKRVIASPWGRLFQAVRDNPGRAAATGHNVRRIKLLSFVVAGAITGFAGGLYALVYGIVPVDAIHWLRSGDIVFMTLIGGSGSFFGPALGAAFFIWLSETVSLFWSRWPMILGVVFALVVLYLRGGIVEAIGRVASAAAARRRAGESA